MSRTLFPRAASSVRHSQFRRDEVPPVPVSIKGFLSATSVSPDSSLSSVARPAFIRGLYDLPSRLLTLQRATCADTDLELSRVLNVFFSVSLISGSKPRYFLIVAQPTRAG